jgi:hypothetical protein
MCCCPGIAESEQCRRVAPTVAHASMSHARRMRLALTGCIPGHRFDRSRCAAQMADVSASRAQRNQCLQTRHCMHRRTGTVRARTLMIAMAHPCQPVEAPPNISSAAQRQHGAQQSSTRQLTNGTASLSRERGTLGSSSSATAQSAAPSSPYDTLLTLASVCGRNVRSQSWLQTRTGKSHFRDSMRERQLWS